MEGLESLGPCTRKKKEKSQNASSNARKSSQCLNVEVYLDMSEGKSFERSRAKKHSCIS